MHAAAAEIFGRFRELARGRHAMREHFDFDARARSAMRVEEPHVGAALIDDALAVGRRVPRIEVRVIGVPAQTRAVGLARVQVADALDIREEPDPVTEPDRAGDVSLERREALEFALAAGVDPERARGAAAIVLP